MKITIDGPAGSGKSTIAKELSKRLGIFYLNTGLVYRAFAYVALVEGIEDENILDVFEKPIEVKLGIGETKVFYKGEDISHKLGDENIGKRASQIASIPEFRERINQFFRSLVNEEQALIEGRDAGTHIFPHAPLKIFITADLKERARRRYEQLKKEGLNPSFEEILKAIEERDKRDKNRPIYPFKPPEDAVIIDTTNLSIEDTIEKVLNLLKERSWI